MPIQKGENFPQEKFHIARRVHAERESGVIYIHQRRPAEMRYIFFVNRVQLTTCLHLPANCFGFKDQEIDTEPVLLFN
ncbi:AQG_2a_G0002790.mRNA.1.CDS.1 [Saccharomyces cerevisiae]|nr:Lysine--tRNA ligase, cytoplasmic [Saccharomyces cerevisiae]CAI4255277.1 BGN_3a_G0002430.mRNA.1.CDS.1 [Saccharomyces cerevisiae]CAI4256443.1 AIC_G0002460.mRNA.1.CDS.1 [Saccharomyces cerevisiae]CAI4257502.1 CRL_G0002660.mRNA.1.CDS.1 [Saccharomyces cerevisiae]CAI4257546.1 ABA_G0002560.mRNA.1.CDS.1 [Saccharomyces cerevisiae]